MKSIWTIALALFLLSSCVTKKNTTLSNPRSSTPTGGVRSPTKGSTSSTSLQYIDQYKDIAIREMQAYGVPASIKLAQALLESGNGNSYLAKQANNHFGIKCGGIWNGPSITRSDDNPNDCFRVYKNPEESFKDHSQFLLRKRYEKLFTLDRNDYKAWAKGLKAAGYATNPRYPDLLIDLIERYELYKYDRRETYVEKERREEKIESIIEHKPIETAKVEQIKAPLKMVIYEVKASDTLYAISRKYNVTVEQIKELNALTVDNLTIGQLLVITK